jgi:hypothetical protein
MLGRRERRRPELFVAGSLRGLVPDDHILARVDRVLDLGWLRSEVEPLYRAAAGGAARHRPRGRGAADARGTAARDRARPAADARGPGELGDPLVHRLRPARGAAGPLQPDAHPPALGRRAVPRRPGPHGAALRRGGHRHGGEVVHIDATLVRADVSWDAIARRHAGAVAAADGDEGQGRPSAARRRPTRRRATRPRRLARDAPPSAPPTRTRPWSRTARPAPQRARRQAAHGRGRPGRGGAGRRGHHGGGARTRRPRSRRGSAPSRPSRAARSGPRRWTRRGRRHRPGVRSPGCSPRWRGARAAEAVVPTKAEPSGRRAASSRSAGPSWTPGTGSYAARANASCARTASPTARDSKPAYRASATDRRPCPPRAACIGSEVPRRAILPHKDHPAPPRARREHARWGGARALHLRPPPHPRRRLPRRGQDPARARPRRPARLSQRADPGLPDRRRHHPQAPRRGTRHPLARRSPGHETHADAPTDLITPTAGRIPQQTRLASLIPAA